MGGEIFSQHEFMILTKGVSILLAIGFVLVFIGYWRFLVGNEDKTPDALSPDDYDLLQDEGPVYFIRDFIYRVLGRSPEKNPK